MTENSSNNEGQELVAIPEGRLPEGHPTNIGTDIVTKGNEVTNLETRIVIRGAEE